jgi:hypothetical protein
MQNLFKHTLYTVLFISTSLSLFGQEKEGPAPTGLNNWYIEIAGSGLFYSANYEKVLVKTERWGWVGSVGLGYNPGLYTMLNKVTLDAGTFMAPFHTAALYGPNKEKIEMGLGFTMLAKDFSSSEIVPTGVIGFRVVETNKVCFRAVYTPFIRDGKFESWFGVSLGRNFSTGKRR